MKRVLFLSLLLSYSLRFMGANIGDPIKYEINSGDEFIKLLNDSTLNKNKFEGDSIILKSDIDLSGYSAIDSFSGYLNGNGFSINNQKGPLFTLIDSNGIVRNINWEGNCSISDSYQGIVAKTCKGLIADCHSNASFSQNSSKNIDIVVGGFCAYLDGGIISNCHNFSSSTTGTFIDKNLTITVGAICAESSNGSTIINCSNNAKLRHYPLTKLIAGGIVGISTNTKIVNCSNNELVLCNIEDITSLTSSQIDVKVGGICGIARNCEINHCINDYLIQTNTGYCAGIIATATDCDIINCVNKGKINNIDSYFYSNSAGIVCNIQNTELRDLLNCANFGEIISYTKNAIATGAGISNYIYKSTIGMCANFGSVDVMARGTLSSYFNYNNYDSTDCDIIESSSDFKQWNEFIEAKYKHKLSPWDLTDSNSPSLKSSLWFCSKAFSNCTQSSINIFSADPKQQYKIEIFDNNGSLLSNFYGVTLLTTINNLNPDNEYSVKITNSQINDFTNNSIFTTAKTNAPKIAVNFSNIGYEDCNYTINYNLKGLYVENTIMELVNGNETIRISADSTNGLVTGMLEKTKYAVSPIVYAKIGGEKKSFTFPTIELCTQEFIPQLAVAPKATTANVTIQNNCNLRNRDICFKINDSTYIFNNSEYIEISNLAYNTDYQITPLVIRDNIEAEYSNIIFTTKLDDYFEPISISPNGVMICGTVYTGKIPNTNYYTGIYAVEYRNIGSTIDTKSNVRQCYIVDNRNLAVCYIPFDTDDLIQYRFYSIPRGFSLPGQEKYSAYHAWYLANRNEAFDDIVEPHFFDCRSIMYSTKHYIHCLPIGGDEEIIEWGIAYKYENYHTFNESKLNLKSGVTGYGIELEDGVFVPSLKYIIKFYGKTKDKTYYSQAYSYQDHELTPIEYNSDSAVDIINMDLNQKKPLYYYNLQGIKSERPFKGINIVVFEDGHTEKVVIQNDSFQP